MEIAAGGKNNISRSFYCHERFFSLSLVSGNSVNMVMLINLLFYLTLENGSMECHAR